MQSSDDLVEPVTTGLTSSGRTLGFCIGERYDLSPAAHDYAETIGSRSVEVECANLSGAKDLKRICPANCISKEI